MALITPYDISIIQTFGGNDADDDPLLLDCFEDHPAYLSLSDFSKFCILGRKGSGKTAIFKRMLSDKRHDRFVFGHTFSDYPWHLHDAQKLVGVPSEECFTHSWKYLCLITLSKILLNHDNSQPFSDSAQENLHKIERFIIDSYGSRDPDVTQIFSKTKKLRFSGDVGLSWGIIKAGQKSNLSTCRIFL